MRQLTGADAFMLYAEAGGDAANNLACLNIYDPSTAPNGAVTFADVLEHIEHRLSLARGFREKLVRVPFDLDHPWWIEDANFDLEFHVREIALPHPGDWRQLATQAARIHSRGFDFSRPPWELYMISGLDAIEDRPPGCFALLLRVHHTVVDGVAGIELLSVTHDLSAETSPVPLPADAWHGEPVPSNVQLVRRAVRGQLARPLRLGRAIARTIPIAGDMVPRLTRSEFPLLPDAMPRTRFNSPITSPHRVFDGRTFDFAEWRTIKRAVPDATINDVALTIVGGTLRRYLDHHGELPDQPIPAAVPISLRPKDSGVSAGNDVGSMFTSLCTDVEDPLKRLMAVQAGTAASKLRKEALGARTLTAISNELPGNLIGVGLRALPQLGRRLGAVPGLPLPVTNIPGAPVPLYFAGARMLNLFGLGPVLHGMALIHIICTYNGIAHMSVTASRDVLPDVAFYGDCMDDAFAELRDAAR